MMKLMILLFILLLLKLAVLAGQEKNSQVNSTLEEPLKQTTGILNKNSKSTKPKIRFEKKRYVMSPNVQQPHRPINFTIQMASDSKNGALGSLMVKVKESLSYNSEIYFNNKKNK